MNRSAVCVILALVAFWGWVALAALDAVTFALAYR